MKPIRLLALAALLATTAACSERYVVRADSTVMVIMDRLDRKADPVTASVLVVMAAPAPMGGGDHVTEMTHQMVFDCAGGRSTERESTITLTDGRVISDRKARLEWETPTPDTLGATILATACDPAVAKEKSSLNSLATMRRMYRKRLGQPS